MAKFVFITGGVVSSLGKGLTSASLGALLQARGFSVRLRKLDPYLNVDPGTMSPFEHGEVFVTDDGAETDLDLGHYERFTGVAAQSSDSVSSGRIYSTVLERERKGDYLGETIQVIPHVTNEIKKFLKQNEDEVDFMLCEIGGTIGDIEGLPFFEAIRQFSQEKNSISCIFVHLTLLPFLSSSGELKTKPTQHSVKELRSLGISPDCLICRSEQELPKDERKKIALFCSVDPSNVISMHDVYTVYSISLLLNKIPRRTAQHALWALKVQGLEHLAPHLEEHIADDLSWWDKAYEPGLNLIEEPLRSTVKRNTETFLEWMAEPYALVEVDLDI